jgi:hypothetical protein
MAALVLENLAAWPFYAKSLRTLLARTAHTLMSALGKERTSAKYGC